MKRNFLLMLLLTLLPLVGWAANYNYVQVTWSPNSTSTTFTGGTMALPVPTVTYRSGYSTYTLSSSNYTVTWQYNGSSTVTVGEHAGTYTATITHTGDNWYSNNGYGTVTTTHTYTISRAANTISAPSFPDGSSWKYGETPNAPSSTTTDGVATYQYSLNGSTWLDWPVPTNTKPGTYSVRAQVAQTVDYNAATSTASTFTIEKAPVTVTLGNVAREWKNPWANPAMDEITETVSGGGKTWDLIRDNFDWNQLETVGDVGNYAYSLTVNATGLADEYFEYIVTGTGTVNVEKNTKASVAGGGDVTDLVYDGTAQQLKPATVCAYRDPQNNEAGKVQYRITAPAAAVTEWSDDIPTAKDADTYTIEVRGVGDVNHTDYQDDAEPLNYYDVTINPYQITTADFNEPTALTVTYKDDTPHEQVIAEAATWKDGTLKTELEAGAEFWYPTSTDLTKGEDVGKYNVEYTINVTDPNFVWKGGIVTLSEQAEITKADIADADVTAPEGETGLEYILDTHQELIATAAVCAKGTPKYSVDGGAWTDDLTKIVGEHVKAGDAKYVVSWYIEGDANHNDFGSTTNPAGTVEVGIAPVDFVLTADAEVATGLVFNNKAQKLLSKSVTGGAANMPVGSTTWSLDGTALAAGSTYEDVKATHAGEYTISYTVVPGDAKYENDYNPYSKELKATIDQYTLYIGGNEIEGTIEDVVDLATGTPKISMADFIKDGALIGGEDDATKAAILNSLIAPTQTLEEIITNAKVGVNAVGLQAVDVAPAKDKLTNYKVDAAHLLSNAASLKINAMEAAIQTAPVGFAATELTYNGDDQELVKTAAVGYKANGGAGTVAIGKVVYSLEETGEYTDDLTKIVGKDADTYTVYYKVELDESDAATNLDRFYEYTAGVKSFDVIINQKELKDEMFVLTPTETVYNGENQLPVITTKAGEPITTDDWYFEFADGKGNPIANPNTGVVNADVYAITFTAEADGNYKGTASATWTIEKADATCDAPVAATLTYNGKNQELVAEPTYDGGTLEYSLDGTNWAEEIPTGKNADTYEVYYRVVADGNHNDFTCTDPVEVTIAPKALTRDLFVFENTPAENPTQDFTGEVLKFEYAVADAEAAILTASDYVCDKDDVIVDAGDYIFTFTGKENYTGTFTVTCTVAPIEQNVVAPKAINLTYNGGEQVLVEAGSTDAVAGSTAQPAGVVEYQVVFDGDVVVDWTSELAEVVGTNAGVYTVNSRAIASEVNYTNPKVENSVDVEILKANIGYMLSNIEKTWNGETFSAEEVEKLFTLYAGELKGNDVYDVPFTLNLPEDYKDAGTYTFKQPTVTFKEGYPVNYKVNFSGEAQVVIDKKDIEDADFTAPVANELTFNGADQALVEAGEVTTEYEEKAIGTVLYATAEDGEYTETIPVGKDAGEYSVWYYVQGDKNHNDTEATEIAVTIAPKIWDAVLAFEDATGEDALLYNTKDQMPNTELKDDKTALEKGKDYTLVIAYTPANETGPLAGFEPKELINVGKYEFTYTGINNYEGATAKRTIEIAPADLAENVTMSKFEATKVYNAKDQKPAITLTYEGYTLEADKDFTVVAADEMINAGEYEFVFTAVAGGNYTGEAKATFEIEKKEAIAEAADATKVYDGTDAFEDLPVLTFKNIELADDPATAFTYEADAFVFDELSANVGTYAFTVDVEKIESDNYYVSQANGANFTITPAKLMVNWNSEADPFTKVYGEKDPELKATTANLDITGAVAGEEEDIAAQTAITRAEGEAVGEYAITLAAAENAKVFDNYEVQFTGADAAFVITPATVKVSIATLEKVYDGEAATIEVKAEDLIVTGLQNGDKKEDIFTTLPTATVADGKAVNVGTYEVTLADAVAGDYEVEYMTSTFNITPAKIITATIAKQQIQKGQDVEENIDATAFTIEGVVAADADKFYVTVNDKYQDMDGKVSASKGTYTDGLVIAVDEEVADNYEGYEKFFGDLLVLPAEATVIADNADWTIDKDTPAEAVTFTDRSINAGFWNVVALPFEASVAQISEAFGYAAVDVLNEAASDGNIHFQVISSGKVPAYTPFIVKTTEDEELIKNNFNEVVFYDVTLEAWPAAKNSVIKDAANNEFIGTFLANTEIPAKSQEYWYMSKGTWYDTMNRTKAVNLKAFRAYVHFDPANVAAGARIFIEEPDGTETAIDAVEFNNMVNGDTYTVDGMKVNKAQKGVYIQNGKKIAVK